MYENNELKKNPNILLYCIYILEEAIFNYIQINLNSYGIFNIYIYIFDKS